MTGESSTSEVAIHVSFDGAWQKRGSGRSYNSLTGHATLLGERTGKCIQYGIKSSVCRKCDFIDEKGDMEHDFRRNHEGSAKSMESSLAVQMIKELHTSGCKVNSITMDDDSTTISRLRAEVNEEIEKHSDKNHVRINVSRDLMLLQQKHKLSTSVINYLTKDISYEISQNKGDSKGLDHTLNSIIPHAFGDHELCDESWCQYNKNPDNYRHRSLPYGKDLVGADLKEDITKLFSTYAKNSDKLSSLGSSQGNESLNYMIAMKAPKAKHFGGSQSLSYRVSSGVSQKNEGRSYIVEVNKNHNLSPGKYTIQQRHRMDKKRRLEREMESTRGAKLRRLGKKGKKVKKERAKETREGKTYSTGVAMCDEAVDISNLELIPPPPPQDLVTSRINIDSQTKSVFFYLETTGFGTNSDIIQLAAFKEDNSVFCNYFIPTPKISASATKVTGFTRHGNILYRNGEIMMTDEKKESLKKFITWLPDNCVLYAHNGKTFDARLLIKNLEENDCIDSFKAKCVGFADTLSLFRELLPERKV